jgi:hypothetical protein
VIRNTVRGTGVVSLIALFIKIMTMIISFGSWDNTEITDVGVDVLTAVVMKISIFWDITPCSPLKVNRRFGGT